MDIAEETRKVIDILPLTHMKKLLEADLNEIVKSVSSLRIHHRYTRSINAIGSALKYIAGTPDYDDFNEIRNKQGELIEANNRQVTINTEMQNHINNLTQTVNLLLNKTKTKDIDTGNLYDVLTNRNKAILRELDNLALSIALGKSQIVNPILLDSKEIDFILNSENRANVSTSEIISNSKIKILQSEDILTFLIKFPLIKFVCKKQHIFPVIQQNKILSFESNVVAKCDKKYVILNNDCKKKTVTSFCHALNNTENSCLNNLLNDNTASCNTISSHNIPTLDLVDDGIIIINDQPATISVNDDKKILPRGTFLITFENELIVNTTKLQNLRKIAFMSPETPIAHFINLSEHTSLLSLPYLHELNIENRVNISQLHFKVRGTVYSLISVTALVLICIFLFFLTKHREKIQFINVVRKFNQTGTSDA